MTEMGMYLGIILMYIMVTEENPVGQKKETQKKRNYVTFSLFV